MKDYAKDTVICQNNLRVFTQAGTIAGAERFLPDIAATGANIVYLCPVAESDDEPNPEYWSTRQKFSDCQNPGNPYRSAKSTEQRKISNRSREQLKKRIHRTGHTEEELKSESNHIFFQRQKSHKEDPSQQKHVQ